MSLFELPTSRHARTLRLILVLALDAMLAGAGIFLLMAYMVGRHPAAVSQTRSPARSSAVAIETEPARATGAGVAAPEAIAALTAAAASHAPDLQRCYRRAVGASGSVELAGSLVLGLSIEKDGRLQRVAATTNDTGSPQLAACVVALVDGWTVPTAAARDVELEWRFHFRPGPVAPRANP